MMKFLHKSIFSILLLQSLGFGGSALMVENELLVRFDDGLSREDIELVLLDDPLEIVRQISRPLNLWLLRVDLQKSQLSRARRNIENVPEIRYTQNNHFLSLRAIPDDPLYAQQWNFNNTGFDLNGNPSGTEDADIDAPEAWEISTGGVSILGHRIVAGIVDGGCDMDHGDLLDNLWINPADTAGNGIDDDNNGWVDDFQGWNAYNHDGIIPQINLDASHGTHVAGIVGAHSNNGNQVAGINWNVELMIVAGASTTTSVAMEAYSYILEQKLAWLASGGAMGAFVVVTNSSFGIDYANCDSVDYPVWNDMYNALGEAGILSVAATANRSVNVDLSGDVPTSCTSPYLITVTNTTKDDTKSSSAGYGAESIDLGAPGHGILSTNYNQGVSTKYGTSMAAPHVTGAVALMHAAANVDLALYNEAHPDLAAMLFKSMLLASVDSIPALQGITLSGGRLNLHAAVMRAANWSIPGDGDLNGDDQVNIQDVVILVQLILGIIEPTPELLAVADLNSDGNITIQDLVFQINTILQ